MSLNKARVEALLKLVDSATREAVAEYEKAGGDVPSIDSTEPHPMDDAINQIVLKGAIRTLEGACAQLCTTLAPPTHTIMNLIQVHDNACLRVAVRENITNVLMDYPNGIHVNELSKIVKIESRKLVRLLRLLATKGCYREVETDTFANNRLSMILHSENPVRNLVIIHEAILKGDLMLYETLKDPRTAYSDDPIHAPLMYAIEKEGTAGTHFDWMKQQDDQRESYQRAMKGYNKTMGSLATLVEFPFDRYSTIVDVGGGIGSATLPVVKIHKHIKVTIQDLPEVLDLAHGVWATECPELLEENRADFVKLNFLTQIPVKGKDIYYLRNIIHDWPDREAATILRNVRQALGPHSRVLIHSHLIKGLSRQSREADVGSLSATVAPEPLLPNFGVGAICTYQLDLGMWILTNAKERTLKEFSELASAAGLKLEKIWDLNDACVLEYSAAAFPTMTLDDPDV